MLEVKNLTKVYKSKKNKRSVKALDNLNFALAGNGMVFIIGKSGSGKSTLLNMLGGLDEITEGEIIVNGNKFSEFSHGDYDNYRNTCTGFIFQDFHLLDDLTVGENVALSLDLQRSSDEEKIAEALKRVDLEGYEKRYPVELSGGQKQRVAIARALVKNPSVLFADEPTGNLDAKTTTQILDLLKEISKTKLVLIVSHNLNDADKYADRILELSDGVIINDMTRREDFCEEIEVESGVLRFPYLKKFTPTDEAFLEAALASGEIQKIEQKDDKFLPTGSIECTDEKVPIKKSGIKFSKLMSLTGKFIKKGVLRSVFSAFMAACVIVILALSQLIVTFTPGNVIKEELLSSKQTILALQNNKVYEDDLDSVLNTETLVEIEEGDIQAFRDKGYEGNIHELTNYSISITGNLTRSQSQRARLQIRQDFYIRETLGTLITTEEFLIQKFGVNGALPIICGTLDDNPSGVIITDYMADAILRSRGLVGQYELLLGKHETTKRADGYINAVIETGYEERYKDLLDMFSNLTSLPDYSELSKNQDFLAAYDEIVQYLGIAYSVNPNFKEDCLSLEIKDFVSPGTVLVNGIEATSSGSPWFLLPAKNNLTGHDVMIGYEQYNRIFKTSYGTETLNTFEPHPIQVQVYRAADQRRTNPIHTYTLNVISLVNTTGANFYGSEALINELRSREFITYGLYFDDIEDISGIYETGTELGFVPNSVTVQSTATMTRAVSVFSDFFFLIAIVLYVACIFVLVNFGVKTVRDKTYEIGVIKALGGKSRDLSLIFTVEILIVGVLTCVFSWIGLYLFIGVANDVLVASLAELATSHVVKDMNFLVFDVALMGMNSAGVIALTLISTLIPMLALKNIKPINIIKAKE